MRKRKIISVAVLVCMLVSMLPVPLFAAEADMPAVESEALAASEETAEGLQDEPSDTWEDLEEEIMELADEGDPAVSGSCGVNLNWTFNESTGILHISGTGEMEDYVGAILPSTPWFHLKDSITKVVIGDGVTSIGDASFYQCDKITDVQISESVTDIGKDAFFECKSVMRVEIPGNVESIGMSAFMECQSLTEIILPEGLVSVGDASFSMCTSLVKVVIPESVTSVGQGAFSECINLTAIDIPGSVTYIGNSAFGGCSKLQEVVIPDHVKTIGAYAFSSCTDLRKIVILDNVTEFGEKVFDQSSNVTIYGYTGSEAEAYANAYQIPFVPLTKPEEPDPEEPDPDKPGTEEPDPDKPGTEEPDPDKPGTEDPSPSEFNISNCTITIPEENYVYDGTAKTPKPVVKFVDETLTEDKDYVLIYGNNTNAGIATITVIGMGDFSGGEKEIFSIAPKEIEDLNYRYFEEVSYRGLELRPGVTITYKSLTLKNLTDYVLKYENNKEVGTASVTITGTGNYKGVKKLDFTIAPKHVSTTLARLNTYSFHSDGKEKTPEVILMNGKDRLAEGQDYALTYVNNVKPGVAVAFIEGMGNFTGTLQLKFTIRMATPVLKNVENTSSGIKISWKKVAQAESYKLFRRVKDTGKWEIVANLTGTSYTDKKAKTNGRTYQYKVYGVADDILSSPSGFRTICYLSKPGISGVTSSTAGQITVKWKKNKKAEGYEIQYATKKDFSNAKKVSVFGGKTVKKNLTKLKKNQKYYIRIRSYTRSSGEYYSPWSAKKSLKTVK